MSSNRLKWVDCSKGIAIILVVLGHALTFFTPDMDSGVRVIYSFHMPLFFILSGVVSTHTYKKYPFSEFVKRKAKSLMMPYIYFALVLAAYKIFRDYHKGNLEITRNIILNTLLVTRKSYISGLWFLPCYLIAHSVMFFIMKCKRREVRIVISVAISVWIVIMKHMINFPLPMNIDNALVVLPYIEIGIELKEWFDKETLKVENTGLSFLVCALIFIVLNFVSIYNKNSIIYYADIIIDNYLFALLMGISGSCIIVIVSQKLDGVIGDIISYCGRNSLVLYGLHYAILGIIFQVFKRVWMPKTVVECIVFVLVETFAIFIIILTGKYVSGYLFSKMKMKDSTV